MLTNVLDLLYPNGKTAETAGPARAAENQLVIWQMLSRASRGRSDSFTWPAL